jgi:hypothetical protein
VECFSESERSNRPSQSRLTDGGTQTIPDSQCVQNISSAMGYSYASGWEAQGQVGGILQGEFPQYTFVDDMWTAYRSTY